MGQGSGIRNPEKTYSGSRIRVQGSKRHRIRNTASINPFKGRRALVYQQRTLLMCKEQRFQATTISYLHEMKNSTYCNYFGIHGLYNSYCSLATVTELACTFLGVGGAGGGEGFRFSVVTYYRP
jgi:hypothetical protein